MQTFLDIEFKLSYASFVWTVQLWTGCFIESRLSHKALITADLVQDMNNNLIDSNVNVIAKLRPSSSSSWSELALLSVDPATHPHPQPARL